MTDNTAKDTKKEEKKKTEAKTVLPQLEPGLTVKIHQKIKESNTKGEEKERIQVFEGIVLSVRKPKSPEGTFTLRKISHNVGVEKVFPIKSPNITKIEILKKAKVTQAKLYYLRAYKKRLKEKKVS